MKLSSSNVLALVCAFPSFCLAHTSTDAPVKSGRTVFTEEMRQHILDDFLASSAGKRLPQLAATAPTQPSVLKNPVQVAAGAQMSAASLLRMATLAQISPYVAPTGNGALMAASFAPFKPKVRFYWDGTTFYEESDNLPDGMPNRMAGITSWQQQIPLPVAYFANTPNPEGTTTSLGFGQPNYWRLPLVPTPAATPTLIFTPGSTTNNFQRGAIALASNGVAIFNPANNTGRVSYEIGELDYYGGHCGLADDYHYHIIPMHLSSRFGGPLSDDKAVAWALDGYPIYGYVEPDGTTRQALDTNGGHNHGGWGYHYHAVGNNTVDATHPYGTPQSPYTMTSFYGTVVNLGGQVDGQPEVGSIRQDGTGGYNAKPIGGASIVAMLNPAPLVVDGSGNLSLPATSINLTGCASTFQSTTITCASTTGLVTGLAIVGAGVANNSTVTSITSATQFVISQPAIATTTAQSFTAVPMAGATNDQYVMRVNMSGTNYDECWRINRNVNPRTLTVTWRAQALISGNLSGPVVTTTNTYTPSTGGAGTAGTAASNRLAAYTVAGWSEVKLPDTSQTLKATTTFGEDSDYTINAQSFTDNADGTITDNVTGLMWQKMDNGESTWETAVANATTVSTGGYTDWRLPTPAELFSIFNHQNLNPALDTTYFPNNPAGTADYWWTSDIYGNSTTNVWCSNAGGGLGGKPKSETLSYTPPGIYRYSARYVRGTKPSNLHSYVNNLDGTVTDTDTGLMWTQVPAAATTWDAALSYAENLSLDGYTDWRLPNIKELQTLTDYTLTTATSTTNIKASINRTVFAKTLTNCTTTSGSTLVTCADTTGLLPGMPIVDATDVASTYVSNTTVPTITSVTSGTTFVMSSAATGSGSLLTLKALAPPTACWSSTSLRGDTTKAWLVETGINNTVLAANGPTRNSQGIISYEAKTSSYPIFVVRSATTTVAPPTITSISNATTMKNNATTALTFTVGDAVTAVSSLTLSASSSNPTLVPAANVTFSGSGASRTVTVTPASGQTGSATITVTVSNGSSTTSTTFTVTVTPPNILLIIADDVGIDVLSQYSSLLGNSGTGQFPPTPNITALAANGLQFNHAYTSTVCSPSRSCILTGRYGYRTGVGNVVAASSNNFLQQTEFTLPRAFAANSALNFQLKHFGKWHLTALSGTNANLGPCLIGGWPAFSGSLPGQLSDFYSWTKVVSDGTQAGTSSSTSTTYETTDLVNDAITFINTQTSAGKPWFTTVAFNAPHITQNSPWYQLPPTNLCPNYASLPNTTADILANPRSYYDAMIQALDTELGRLLANVDLNKTNVIFVGDNGTYGNTAPNSGSVAQSPVAPNKAKSTLYEGGIRVPLFIRGPDVASPGRTTDALTHFVDLYATILEMAGINVASTVTTAGATIDSKSLLPVLRNATSTQSSLIYSEEFDVAFPTLGGRCLRDSQYKLIRNATGTDEFYDLQADPYEATNLLAGGVGAMTTARQTAYNALVTQLATFNTAPTISTIAAQNTVVSTATSAITFTVGDAEMSPAILTVSSNSSNTTLVPAANVVLGGSGATRTVTVTPATGLTGSSTITVSVTDGEFTASSSFVLIVGTLTTVSSVATNPTTPTNTDAVTVTANVAPATGRTISNVQLQYNTGAQTTGTVFDEIMTTIPLGNPWSGSGSGALNAWTVSSLNGGTVTQAGGAANHTTPITLTACTTTSGGTSVSCASTTGLWPGMILYGPNVPAGTTVSSVTNATTFVMSTAATGAGSALTLYGGGITLTNCSTTNASATVTCGSTVGLVAAVTQSLTGGSTTNGSGTVTVASTASLQPGMNVSGTGIPNGATISSITSSTQFVMNPPANATNSAQTYTASFSGMVVTGAGIPNNATITSITNSTQFVISANATATGSGVTLTAAGCGLQLSKGSSSYTDTMVTTTNAIPAAGTAGTLQFWVQTQNLVAGNGWTMQLSPDGGTTWNTRASESYSSSVNLANCVLTSGSPNVTCTSTVGLAAGMALTGQSLSLTGCSTTSGSTSITCASTTGLVAGMVIVGTGIPNNSTVSSITNGTQFVLSANASATNSAQTFTALATVVLTSCATTATSTTVTCADTSKLLVGMVVSGPGLPLNGTVASITNSTTFVLSSAANQTATNQNFTASYLPSAATVLSITDTTHFVMSTNATITASAVPLAAATVNHGFTQFTYSLAAGEMVNTLKLRFQFSGYNPPAPTRAPLVNIDDITLSTTVGSAPVTLAMTSTGNGVYSVQLPLQTTGTTVSYTITATDSSAGTSTSTGSYTVVAAVPVMAVTPSTAFSASGAAGSGTFTPASLGYTLTNTGTGTLSWTAGKTAAWLNLSSTSGTLAAGANTTVTASINTASANSLSAASYNDTITFTNTTNASGSTTRAASLLITNGIPTAPVAPSLTLPAYSAGTSQWINWPAVATATSYTLQIASSSNFTTSLLSSQTVTSPSASFANLSNGVTYYYRVLATNSVGSSAYSSTTSSTQDTVAPTVSISTPATGGGTAVSSITVTGTSSDSLSGVSGVKVNNVAATSSNNFTTWSATVPLGFGTNAIIATAIDGAGNLANSSAITVTLTTAQTYNPLVIPAAINGTAFNLNLYQTNKQFPTFSSTNPTLGINPSTTLGPSPGTTTLGYNGALMWGPTLIMNQGDTVQINVSNLLDLSNSTLLRSTTTTVHWHGFHIPAIMDGGPRQVVAGGSTWSPTFTMKNNAATYWYHPHLHMATQEQLTLGAGGFIIVRDPQEAALALPRTYGVDDIPLAVTTRRFLANTNEFSANQYVQADGSTSSTDNYGDYVLVNGTMNPQVSLPKQFVRLRILNADIQRGYRFGFSDNRNFYVIANDQGLLNAPVQVSQVTMMIGERVEILVDLSQDTVGTSIDLKAYDNLGTAGGPGGAFFGFGGSESNTRTPNGNSGPENGGLLCNSDFIVLHINVAAATSGAITSVPATLASNTYWTNANVTNTRTVSITGGNGGTPGFSFNNIAYSPTVNNFTIPLNAVEKWVIQAGGVFGHSLHIHDIKFNIIARNLQTGGNSAQIFNTVGGVATSSNGLPASYESGWKDTVYVPKGETVTVIAKYDDFASPNNPYMFHCHMLNHEDGGLMGQFVVTSSATETIAAASSTRTGTNNTVSFDFNATTGSSFLVQYSPDMTAGSWVTVGVATSDGTSATYTETDTTRLGLAKGFYRAVIPAVIAPPVITSSATASGTHGAAFSYQITATNSPTGYSAILQSGNTAVPGGLSVNPNTGLISGTPTTAGTYNIEVSASNSGGTARQIVVLTVN